MTRVAIDVDLSGNFRVFADDGVEVYVICDHVPEDRVYLMTPEPIPDGMIDGPVGFNGDGSPADTRAKRALAHGEGRPHLSVVEGDA